MEPPTATLRLRRTLARGMRRRRKGPKNLMTLEDELHEAKKELSRLEDGSDESDESDEKEANKRMRASVSTPAVKCAKATELVCAKCGVPGHTKMFPSNCLAHPRHPLHHTISAAMCQAVPKNRTGEAACKFPEHQVLFQGPCGPCYGSI